MAVKTPIYGYEKPDPSDYYDVEVFNRNSDISEKELHHFDSRLPVVSDTQPPNQAEGALWLDTSVGAAGG